MVDEASQCREGGPDSGLVFGWQPVQGSADALLVGVLPAGKFAPPRWGESHHSHAPVMGIRPARG
jgi:hypothetical protein